MSLPDYYCTLAETLDAILAHEEGLAYRHAVDTACECCGPMYPEGLAIAVESRDSAEDTRIEVYTETTVSQLLTELDPFQTR
jgi:hypothetical protein